MLQLVTMTFRERHRTTTHCVTFRLIAPPRPGIQLLRNCGQLAFQKPGKRGRTAGAALHARCVQDQRIAGHGEIAGADYRRKRIGATAAPCRPCAREEALAVDHPSGRRQAGQDAAVEPISCGEALRQTPFGPIESARISRAVQFHCIALSRP